MNERESLVELHDLSVIYPGAAAPAVSGVNLSVRRGGRLLLLGPSGCGKSTLLFVMAGIIPDVVPATLRGQMVTGGARIGVVLQNPEAQMIAPTVEEEIAFGLENHGVPPVEMEQRITGVLSRFGLEAYRHWSPSRLSGGEAQKVALAAAVALEPELLFLDEPTAFLDPVATRDFFSALSTLSPDTSLVIVEHKLEYVLPVVDRYVRLSRDGSITAEGNPAELSRTYWYDAVLDLVQFHRPASGSPQGVPSVEAAATRQFEKQEPVLRCRDVRHVYAGGKTALDGMDLDVREGECVVIMGSNGSGKSTFLDKISAVLPVQSHTILLRNADVGKLKPAALYETLLAVPQNPEHMFLTEKVEAELDLSTPDRDDLDRIASDFGIAGLLERNPYTLSEGEKRRLTVASAVLDGRHLLLFDEPTYGLDAEAVATLVEIVRDLSSQGATLLIVTHSPELAFLVADRILMLERGRIVFSGTPADLASEGEIDPAFLPVWERASGSTQGRTATVPRRTKGSK